MPFASLLDELAKSSTLWLANELPRDFFVWGFRVESQYRVGNVKIQRGAWNEELFHVS